MNSKINALRDSISSLRFIGKEEEGEDTMDSDAGERRKAQKWNKANTYEVRFLIMLLIRS